MASSDKSWELKCLMASLSYIYIDLRYFGMGEFAFKQMTVDQGSATSADAHQKYKVQVFRNNHLVPDTTRKNLCRIGHKTIS